MDILRNADCRRADKNYLIFLPFLRCGNIDEGRRGGGVGVRGEEGEGEGQVDPPLIGCDRRLTEPSLDYRVVKYSESAAAPISW